MRQRPLQATVIGPSDANPAILASAEAIGAHLAARGVTVLTGGGGGVMEAASRGAVLAGGLTVGILPGAHHERANRWCKVVIPTGMGDARNALTAMAGDMVIVLGGAAGTLSEICHAWLHQRPILALTTHGGWAERLAGEPLDHRQRPPVQRYDTLELLLTGIDRCSVGLERAL